jgi:hypothetical protein
MSTPTIIDIPHGLGRDETKRRMGARVGKIAKYIPGGAATVTSSWPSEYRLAVTVSTFGQDIPCTIDAEDTLMRVTLHLPGIVKLMAGPISTAVRRQGERMVQDKRE